METNKEKVFFLTLGCSKNDIDTEVMIDLLDKDKYQWTNNLYQADTVIINTCSFILDAKEQSIETIIEIAQLKNKKLRNLIVAGCLGQRYPQALLEDIPEIDFIIGTGELDKINLVLEKVNKGERGAFVDNINSPYCEQARRVDFKVSQYVKISEGCNNHCTYCIIPKLRGKMRSRKIEDIKKEVEYLVQNGTKEIILIAQNTSEYGKDIYGTEALDKLLYALNDIEGLEWIRILYMYPEGITDGLIEAIGACEKVVKYIDMPLQHISNSVLKMMGRKTSKEKITMLIDKLRDSIPEIIIRSTFIVGFYNEGREEFDELIEFIKSYQLDRVGVFEYSLEEDTPAYKLGDPVSQEEKNRRKEELMLLQMAISKRKLQKRIGDTMKVLVESEDKNYYIGRSYMDAPGIDGNVLIEKRQALKIGEFNNILIKDSNEYDLIG